MQNNIDGVNPQFFGEKIKSATSQLHILLESNSLLSAIVNPRVTLWQYSCYLSLMQNILSFYENDLQSLLSIDQRKSTTLIAADLQHINYNYPPGLVIHPYDIGNVQITVPFAWGFAYVMEGSKLGGKAIFKNIHRALSFPESAGARFISDFGANTYVAWKEWMIKLATYAAANNCEEEIIAGAKYAFESVYTYFELNRLYYED